LVATSSVTDGGCGAGDLSGGPDLTSPEMESWLAGNQDPLRAPAAVALPVIVGGAHVGEDAECKPEGWTGDPSLRTSFVEPKVGSGSVVQTGTSSAIQIPLSAVGQELACVSVASNEGGTTEALSSNGIMVETELPAVTRKVSSASGLIKIIRRSRSGRRWIVALKVEAPEVGQHARVRWLARNCSGCRHARTMTVRHRTRLVSPKLGHLGPVSVELALPQTESGDITYSAAVRKIGLEGQRRKQE
jgi:hypothetical protein